MPQAVAYLPQTVFSLTWKAIHPFMDTATRNKVWAHAWCVAAILTAQLLSIKTTLRHFDPAVTACVQVTFINNVKKAREALAGLMDVSNLERCVVLAHAAIVLAGEHESTCLQLECCERYRGHVWPVLAGVSVGTATTSSTSRNTAASGSRATPSGSRSCSEAHQRWAAVPAKLAGQHLSRISRGQHSLTALMTDLGSRTPHIRYCIICYNSKISGFYQARAAWAMTSRACMRVFYVHHCPTRHW